LSRWRTFCLGHEGRLFRSSPTQHMNLHLQHFFSARAALTLGNLSLHPTMVFNTPIMYMPIFSVVLSLLPLFGISVNAAAFGLGYASTASETSTEHVEVIRTLRAARPESNIRVRSIEGFARHDLELHYIDGELEPASVEDRWLKISLSQSRRMRAHRSSLLAYTCRQDYLR
jgi:hypothetical protein